MLRRLRSSRSHAERVPLPHPLPWAALGCALITLGAATVAPGVLGITGTLSATPLQRLSTGTAGDTVGTVLAIAGVLALRYAAFARLAQRPGPVEVTVMSSGPESVAGPDAAGATAGADGVLAEFRRALIEMSIATPHSVPNSPQDDGFLDNVTTIAEKPGNWLATAAGLLKALLQVRYAYRVAVQTRHRSGPTGCGITLHMVARPGNRGIIDTIWSDSWGAAAERAAHRVGAFIVVRSRLSRRGAWSGWHGLEMPPNLFHYSQLGRQCKAENRFEEAIGHFHDALKLDPLNPYLRVELAQTQEHIGLYLDALTGYADVIAVESWFDRRLWLRLRRLLKDDPTDQPPRRLAAHPVHGRSALLVARYRLVARLTSAAGVSRTWSQSIRDEAEPYRSDNSIRSKERIALRRRASVWLEPYYQLYIRSLGLKTAPPRLKQFSSNERLFRHFLIFVGCAEVMHLSDDYRWMSGRRRPGMPVTQTALQVTRVVAALHRQLAEQDVSAADWAGCGRPRFTRSTWPPAPADIDSRLTAVLRRKPSALREWQEHYNAACAVAVALTPLANSAETQPADLRRDLSLRAVRHLERAVSATDSHSVGSYAQWLSTGDEDLRFLRPTPAFIDFLDRHLPNPAHRDPRPDNLIPLLMTLHSLTIVQRYCELRIAVLGNGGKPALDELAREAEACRIVRNFLEQDQDWNCRLALISEGKAFCSSHQLKPFTSRLPPFQDEPAVRSYADYRAKLADDHENDGTLPANSTTHQSSERMHVEQYYREVVQYRRSRRRHLIDATPPPPRSRGGRRERLSERLDRWVRLGEVIDASFLPPAEDPAGPGNRALGFRELLDDGRETIRRISQHYARRADAAHAEGRTRDT